MVLLHSYANSDAIDERRNEGRTTDVLSEDSGKIKHPQNSKAVWEPEVLL